MKQTFKTFFVAIMAVSMVSFAGCSREDDNSGSTGDGGGNPAVEWVDLGLPSGLLWASCNVGATAPEEYGDYFAWGETQPKINYSWSTYAYGNDYNQLIKYCPCANYGLDGFTDDLTILESGDDAATANLGNGARTPTEEEWQELMNNTYVESDTLNGVYGYRFTAVNHKTIFLPAAGWRWNRDLHHAGRTGGYWSASLKTDCSYGVNAAWNYRIGAKSMYYEYRNYGFPVRAVRAR